MVEREQSSPVTETPDLKERIAIALWHRFAPDHHMEWSEESHAAEYREAAEAVMILGRRSFGVAPTQQQPVGWRWKWGEADFWKMTDDPALVPASAPINEMLYVALADTSTVGNSE